MIAWLAALFNAIPALEKLFTKVGALIQWLKDAWVAWQDQRAKKQFEEAAKESKDKLDQRKEEDFFKGK